MSKAKHRNAESWTLGRRAMVGTLVLGAVQGSVLVIAVLMGRDANVIGDMFAGVCALMVTTLAVLVGGKGWKEYSNARKASVVERFEQPYYSGDTHDQNNSQSVG